MNSLKRSLWRTTVLASVAAGVTAFGAAHAQTAAAADDQAAPAAGSSGDVVVVVGSRIRRDEFTTASPVQIITKDESTLAGLSSTTEILQSSSVTGGQAQINNYFGGFVVDGGPGVNTLSLRGLGATRTLILLNGRRMAPAGTRGSVGSADLNTLPSAMVERIEILKDGASSIYGSDAVAGVVNIITERGINGWSLEGQYNTTEHGGGDQSTASIVGGYTSDAWEISGSLEYYEREILRMGDRDWTQCQVDGFRDPDTGASLDYIDPRTGQPKCYVITGTGSNGVTVNTIGTPAAAGVPAAGNPTQTGVYNRWRPNSAITTGLVGFEGVSGASTAVRDTFDTRAFNNSMVSPARTYTGFLQGSFDTGVLGNAEAYFELLVHNRLSSQTGFRQLSLDYATNSPLLPAQLNALAGTVAGAPAGTKVRGFIGFGNDRSSQEEFFYKGTAGFTGDFVLPDWRYDVSATYSKSDADYTFESFLSDRLAASLNVTGTQAAGFTCVAVATRPDCVAAPYLTSAVIGGELPTNWVNYVWRPVTGNTQYDETMVTATIDGPIFQLPAGAIKGAFGLEYRTSEIDDTPPPDSVTGNLFNLTSAGITRGTDSVQEAFAEIEIPIFANSPGAYNLTANLSGRYTDYDSYGEDTTYKAGLIYSPFEWITARASFGTSYRAPALFEQYLAPTSGFLSSQGDPCNNYSTLPVTSSRYINCNSELNNPAFLQTSSISVISAGGAAQGLAAETSENTSIGIVFQPDLPDVVGDFSFAVDYYNIEMTDQVARYGSSFLLSACYDDPQFRAGGSFCNFVAPRSGTNALTVFDNFSNVATQIAEGYDYNLRWVKDIGEGTLRVNAEVTQYTEQSSKLFDTDPLDDVNGTITNPEFSGQLDLTYDWKNWQVFYRGTWVDAMDSNAYLGVDPTVDPYDFSVDDYYLHNISMRYRSTDDWEFTVGIRNLEDKDPPTIPTLVYNRIGNAPLYSGYDYFGRQFFVNIAKNF